MATVDDFLSWAARDLERWAPLKKSLQKHSGRLDACTRYSIFTATNEYIIRVRPSASDDHGYLGCTSLSRAPRPGESWRRGNDLADGKLCEETWKRIMADIVSYELVRVATPITAAEA
jgi:hypothetical protein